MTEEQATELIKKQDLNNKHQFSDGAGNFGIPVAFAAMCVRLAYNKGWEDSKKDTQTKINRFIL